MQQPLRLNCIEIPPDLLNNTCSGVEQNWDNIPLMHRGIKITRPLIKATMEILNAERMKTLPQNCRNDIRERTPDGLDRRIKETLNTDLRTANLISDVLKLADIVEIFKVLNPKTGRRIKGTKLLQDWCW